MMPSKFIQVVANGKFIYLWLSSIPLYMYIYILHLYLSFCDRHLDRFYILATVSGTDLNIGMKLSFQISVFVLFTCMLDHVRILFLIL